MIVSKEEYLEALDVVEQYHKQIEQKVYSGNKKKGKTNLKEWCRDNDIPMPIGNLYYHLPDIEFVEDVKPIDLLKIRNFGKSNLRHFELFKKATL